MRIDAAERISGHSMLDIRNALRKCGLSFCSDDFASKLGTNTDHAIVILDALSARGWCHRDSDGEWEIDDGGAQFLLATAALPISRKTAQALLAQVVERAAQFSLEYPDWPVKIEKVAVFGSYLKPDATRLGDLDIAVMLQRSAENESHNLLSLAIARAAKEGIHPRSKFDRLALPVWFIRNRLKGRSRSISIHDWSDLVELNCVYEIVWRR